MIESTFKDGVCTFTQSPDAEKCMFLQFLKNTSNFTHHKEKEEITPEEENQNRIHLLSKLCAIGYLTVGYKDIDCTRAVICTNGFRNGKTLFATFFEQILSFYTIPGIALHPDRKSFIWSRMQPETKIVLIDDIQSDFNIEYLYPNLSGDWTINHKGGRYNCLKFKNSPKIIITSEHLPSGKGASFDYRVWPLYFSDHYNNEHNVVDDFGCIFYQEWDISEWKRTWELIADCIQLFLQFGFIKTENRA